MTTIIRRTLALSTTLFALQIAACSDDPMAPESGPEPRFLIGNSPLVPFWLATEPVLETKESRTGQVARELVVQLHVDAREADALALGKRAFQSSASFWIAGDAIALADPRPSPVVGLFDDKDGNKLVVIAMSIDDAWSAIEVHTKPGQTVGVIMDIDMVDPGLGGVSVIHSVEAAGSFIKDDASR